MLKTKVALLGACALFFATGQAQAAVIDAINPNGNSTSSWLANNVGWFYTPTQNYTLSGIGTKFGSTDGRTVTASIWSGVPGSLTLLGSGTLTPIANAFSDAVLAPLALSSSTTYFVSFQNVAGLSTNVTGDVGATNLAGGLRYDFESGVPTFANGPETGFTAQPMVRFLGDANGGAVPEPSTWALLLLGFGVVGASMRRRQKVSVSYA